MAKCSFCGGNMPAGRGKMHVKIRGQILYFCNSKCQRNWNLGRAGKFTKWTNKAKEEKEA